MKWRPSFSVTLPASGFIEPCIPSRIDDKVRIYSRRGADFTPRFPRIVEAVRRLKAKSVLLDGEGIVYGHAGLPDFDLIQSKQYDREVSLVAFDLLELDGDEARKRPLLERKTLLAKLIANVRDGIEFNEHIECDGALIYEHACKLGHEGIIAKRRDLPYESGRSKRWLKIKNPESPAMKRVRDETF